MPDDDLLELAMGGFDEVPPDWVRPTQLRPFYFDDPGVAWLECHGNLHGFSKDKPEYSFLNFIFEKGRAFEVKWITETVPDADLVCAEPWEVRDAAKVRETYTLMKQGVPAICQPALWWAPEGIYGVPDLLLRASWLEKQFPDLNIRAEGEDYYIVLDLKFTTKLDSTNKIRDISNYSAQVRIYSYMLGYLQDHMPGVALLVTRDRIFTPMTIPIGSMLGSGLDDDLSEMRDRYIHIRDNGSTMTPWSHMEVVINLGQADEQWHTAKRRIATELTPGRDSALLYQIGPKAKAHLSSIGFGSLDALLQAEPTDVPLESCPGIGDKRARQIRAILQANRSAEPLRPPASIVPEAKEFEFFVDFEFMNNLNVNFEREWPELEGREMIFMIGVGTTREGNWSFQSYFASAETRDGEREVLDGMVAHLQETAGDALIDPQRTALYHWTSAEVWQTRRAADRLGLKGDHPVRCLPWVDIQKAFLGGPCALPGALDFGLKDVAAALSAVDSEFATHWPGHMEEGLTAMVAGWHAYRAPVPMESEEKTLLEPYIEADCHALWNVLRWLRLCATEGPESGDNDGGGNGG